MRYDLLETELKNRLNTFFASTDREAEVQYSADFLAVEIAENQADANRLSDKSRVHVMYSRSDYADTMSASAVNQEETVYVAFIPEAPNLRGRGGTYELIELIKRCMMGYVPLGAMTGMRIAGYSDWNLEDGVLQNVLEMSFKTINMETVKDDPAIGGAFASVNITTKNIG